MTIVRGRLEPNQHIHTDVIVRFVEHHNPEAKLKFYAEDFLRFGDMYKVNWLGLFAIAYHMTNRDPFWIGVKTPGYELSGGTMSRYARLAQSVSEQYKFGEHFVERDITLGNVTVKGKDIEDVIQAVVEFAKLPPKQKERFPPDGRVVMPEKPKPVEEKKPEPVSKSVPIWWRLARKPIEFVLGAILGSLLGQVPEVKKYAEEIIAMVLALVEHIIF
jgi:hypothetical protein